ncbi:Hypothetical predicted protein [Olea europaea subsp. europaea]|uniref:Uncharacterized protein n=1 Tax=Olea europaea subsp. europaea TaxID=158383 RepID=A0A8S0UUJ4_OLEEU|nr:Hypothetical predicted protein [Olea europaea subsp. europaea]
MRRYSDDSGGGRDAYGSPAAQMNHHQQQQNRSGYYQRRHQEQQEKDPNHHHNQWRWDRDGSHNKLPMNSMSPNASFDEGQGYQVARSYYQDQRPDPQMSLEKQSGSDPKHQPRGENMDIGYEDNCMSQTFYGLEQRFLDDIMKLSKEQTDAEDVENASHREKINTINIQYQEQLAALRTRHAARRNEFLQRESRARQQQYQRAAMDQYRNSHMGTSDPHGYSARTSPARDPHRVYNADQYDSYREQSRFSGSARDQGFEPKVQYSGGRVYDTGSGHY